MTRRYLGCGRDAKAKPETEAPAHWRDEDKGKLAKLPKSARAGFRDLHKRMEAGANEKSRRLPKPGASTMRSAG